MCYTVPMKQQDANTVAHNEEIQPTLRRLLETLECELVELLRSKRNFKVTINGSAGHTFTVEVSKFVKLN